MQLGTASLIDAVRAPERAAQPALVGDFGELTYGDLVRRVDRRGAELDLPERSMVLLAGETSLDWLVTYLTLLDRGHVPLLVGDDPAVTSRLVAEWEPTAVVAARRSGWEIDRAGHVPTELHPDLALLMSTSGSTGSPKLIRLSARNLVANAESIADFQRLTSDDRGITNLPLHYSFGLSVVHAHLLVGASIVVTAASVVDPCFAEALADHGVTNVAGVPHTFDLLDQVGPDRLHVPSLRFLAQAGGRLAPDAIAAWVERTEAWGAEWFTMYGQTEATARISYVPPALASEHPGMIGRSIPGGELSIVPVDDADAASGVGELVYRGDNVMMGYAAARGDLADGRTVDQLHTGDLARFDTSSQMFEIVGRRARRVKPFGVRIDLDDVERRLAQLGIAATVVGDDEVVVAASPTVGAAALGEHMARVTGLPDTRCVGLSIEAPRRASGKIDGGALLAVGVAEFASRTERGAADDNGDGDTESELIAELAFVLGHGSVSRSDSFVTLGGDSLSYIECSLRIERLLGSLPRDWHLMTISELAVASRPRRLSRVDTTVLLRAVGILAVVSTHMRLWHVPGGAHLMLGVVGYNLARFMLPIDDQRERVRAGLRTAARVAVPTVLWTALFMVFGQYTWHTLTLVNNYIGPRSHAGNHWHFWFVEVFVQLVLIATVLTAIPFVRRLDRRWPYLFPLALLGATLLLRLEWADMGDWYNLRFRTHAVAWFFVLGWLVLRSTTVPQKLLTTVVCLATAPGVFMNPQREFFIAFGLVLLVWAREIPVPRVATRPLTTLATASMWIFISHFMIWPPMKDVFTVEVAYPLTVLASLAVWWLVTHATRRAATLAARVRRRRPFPVQQPPVSAPTPA